ncbi:MAG: leucine-rich repeat domain-containing protein [Bacteroidetes bacterium]|nr:leucine-rich repeat domain-containing protein [Bacteroidota bacterium]
MKTLLFITLAFLPIVCFSQNLKKEKVKTSILEYPVIDLNKHSLESIKIEFCTGDMEYQRKKGKKEGTLCQRKSDKKMVKVEAYRYVCTFNSPAGYVRINSEEGEVLYMDATPPKESIYVYGEDDCFISEGLLKLSYSKEKAAFETKCSKKEYKEKYKVAKKSVNTALFFNYASEDFAVHYPKSKDLDYSDLENAAGIAAEGFNAMKGKTGNEAAKGKLTKAIAMWDKALEESNVDDKTARINKKVTVNIMENKARAHAYLFEYDIALETLNKALKLEGNFSNNKTLVRKALRTKLEKRGDAYKKNKDLPINLKKKSVSVLANKGGSCTSFETDYKAYSRVTMVTYLENTGSDDDNPYRPLVMDNGTDIILMIPNLAGRLMENPELAKKISEFPPEICKLTELTSLILKGNTLKAIPVCIGNLTGLTKLNLANNQLTSLPEEIGNLESLKTLTLKGNSIPQSEIDKIQEMLPDCKIKL